MAVYKVAQDVEADDKLIGPFSFRQFIYLIIVAIAVALAWALGQIFIGLAIIPLPVIVFFGALALPLRKDQPMEIYMAALVSYYLKPRRRIWEPDGIESLVEITAPKVVELQRTKDLSQTEAERRLSYLADIADTQGWAIRHATTPGNQSALISDVYYEAQQAEDILDSSGNIAQSFDSMISRSDAQHRQDMLNRMQQTAPAPQTVVPPVPQQPLVAPPIADPYTSLTVAPAQAATPTDEDIAALKYNPYPNSIHQSTIQPLSQLTVPARPTPATTPTAIRSTPQQPAAKSPLTTSENTVSPDIINLANNSDLSVETIAREAKRLRDKDDEQEVVISLR